MSTFKDIELGQIITSPLNPRKHFEGPKFDELVASIRQKGVIEPIIVRPVEKKKAPFEIVAGERRFKAAGVCQLRTIPAIVRELTDDEAYDFMLIENLQREDLTELEEAESFKAYRNLHGPGSVESLAEKTGINPRYVRARIAALALPAYILEAWRKGGLTYAHLAQFLRVSGKDRIKKLFDDVKHREMSALKLRQEINNQQILLSAAMFDVKACAGCWDNSQVQQDLFGLGEGKAACLQPKCFKGKQGAWFKEHWIETPAAKTHKTRGARFGDDLNWNAKHHFYQAKGIPKKCLECDNFVSLVTAEGKIENPTSLYASVCVGDLSCYRKAKAAGQAAERATSREKKSKAVSAGNAPRVTWHGEYFRDLFYRSKIEAKVAELDPASPKGLAVLVALAVKTFRGCSEETKKLLGLKRFEDKAIFSGILKASPAKLTEIARAAVKAIVYDGQSTGDWGGIGTTNRAAVGAFLGIDLAKEYAVTEEYLTKKTKNELLAFGKKSGIFADPKVAAHLARTIKKSSVSLSNMPSSLCSG